MTISIHAQAPAGALVQIRHMPGLNYYLKLISPEGKDDVLASHSLSKSRLVHYAAQKGWKLLEI